jgi:predicted XRE-type DNA-binding protein
MNPKRGHTRSTGNVFEDLKVSSPEEVLAKAELASNIADLIARRGITQVAAARLLSVDQPKVSALLRGRLAGFSTERLMKFLTALGSDVQIVIQRRPHARGRGRLSVMVA